MGGTRTATRRRLAATAAAVVVGAMTGALTVPVTPAEAHRGGGEPVIESRTRVVNTGGETEISPRTRVLLLIDVLAYPPKETPTGKVKVLDRTTVRKRKVTRTLATLRLEDGHTAIRLPRLAEGRHAIVVRYLGSRTVQPSAARRLVLTVG